MARPFLKWAGGKRNIAAQVVAMAPEGFRRYIEPFAGGAAVFFAIRERWPGVPAVLADSNEELIRCFEAVRDRLSEVVGALEPLERAYLDAGKEDRARLYYAHRASEPADPIERAARTIFLNRTGYNGLYRVNKAGKFNVPHGRYVRPRICDRDGLLAASEALQGVQLLVADFGAVCRGAAMGDFVYLDPPYQPLSATSHFTAYTAGDFGEADQGRLRDEFESLTRRGVAAVLSNSDHPVVRQLYEGHGYTLDTVAMGRAINSVGSKRTAIAELLVSNFERREVKRALAMMALD